MSQDVGTSKVARVETFAVAVPFRHRFALGSGLVGSPDPTGDVLFVKITTEDGVTG